MPRFSASKSPSRVPPPPSSLSTRNYVLRDYSPLSKKLSRTNNPIKMDIPLTTERSTKTLKPITSPKRIVMSPPKNKTNFAKVPRLSVDKKAAIQVKKPSLSPMGHLRSELAKITPKRYMSPTMGHLKRFQRSPRRDVLAQNADLLDGTKSSSPHNFNGARRQAWVPASLAAADKIYNSTISMQKDNKEPRHASPQLFARLYKEAERKKK